MRLSPLPEEQWDERVREALASLLPPERRNPRGAGNAMATLVRHPDLAESFLPFSARLLLNSTLPPRLREMAILRVARRCDCAYEWAHHLRIAAKAGLSAAEIEAAGRGEAAGEVESAVLSAVDELDGGCDLSDETWAVLGKHLDERQVMDLVFTVGAYCTLAMALNAFGVQPERKG